MRRVLVVLVTLLAGCAAEAPTSGDPMDERIAEVDAEFDDAIGDLSADYGGEGKADLFGVDPCSLIEPLVEYGDQGIRSGFFMGVEGEAVLGGGRGFGGFDLVWDLYHHQFTVSRYYGAGVGVPGVGASVEAYVGYALGFQEGVSDWDGYFVTAEADFGLPFLREYLSVGTSVFVTARDTNGDAFISPSEIVYPPGGVYGFNIGIELGVEVPTGLPVSGGVTEGLWEPHKAAIRYYYDEFRNTRFLRFGSRLDVHLVDHHTGEECDPDWPDVDPERDCIIEFGEEDWSHTHRGLHVAYSICTATGGCEIPLAWPLSGSAVAIGALEDAGGSLARYCPGVEVGTTETAAH